MTLRRRTIREPLRADQGPNSATLSQEKLFNSSNGDQSVVLCHWQGPMRLVTVVGSSPASPWSGSDVTDMADVMQARLQYRQGGVAREDRWTWPLQGWMRCVAANEITLVATMFGSLLPAARQFILSGAVTEQAYGHDSCVLTFSTPALSEALPQQQLVPVGTRRIRAREISGAGYFIFGWLSEGSGTFTTLYQVQMADLQDWFIFPTNCNAASYGQNLPYTEGRAYMSCRND